MFISLFIKVSDEKKKEDIQIFWMYMSFNLSNEAKNAYFMSEATIEIHFFSLH